MKPTRRTPKTRSPGYPAISLNKAIERAQAMQEHEQRNSAPKEALAKHWGYESKSSGLLLTISALRQYGIIDGRNDMKLTDLAWEILFRTDEEKVGFIKQAAASPDINREILGKFNSMPSDITLRNYLIRDKHFNSKAAENYVKIFRETISFANLDFNDNIGEDGADSKNIEPIKNQNTMQIAQSLKTPSSSTKGQPAQNSFELSTGQAYIITPSNMTKDDINDLLGYLDVWKKKLTRGMIDEEIK